MIDRAIKLEEGEAVLIDKLGTVPFLSQPADRDAETELAILMDLEGKLNKLPERWQGRFLMAVGQAAELVAEITLSGAVVADDFVDQVTEHMERLQAEGGKEAGS